MTVNVRFELCGGSQMFDETTLERTTSSMLDEFRQLRWAGAVVISTVDQPELRIEDEVSHQLLNLCSAACELVAGRAAAIQYWEMQGGYELVPLADRVIVSGDYVQESHFEIGPLVHAILACADRYVVLMSRLADPAGLDLAAEVTSEATRLREALRVRTSGK